MESLKFFHHKKYFHYPAHVLRKAVGVGWKVPEHNLKAPFCTLMFGKEVLESWWNTLLELVHHSHPHSCCRLGVHFVGYCFLCSKWRSQFLSPNSLKSQGFILVSASKMLTHFFFSFSDLIYCKSLLAFFHDCSSAKLQLLKHPSLAVALSFSLFVTDKFLFLI